MKTYIVLIRYTPQRIEALKEAPHRAERFGHYDGVVTFQSPDDTTAHRAILTLSHMGNVKTETLRAYDQAGMEPLLSELV